MAINTATATLKDLEAAETSELSAVFNKITGKSIKKFENRGAAISRTWKAIQQLAPGENIEDDKTVILTKKEKPVKAKKAPSVKTKEKSNKRDDYENRVIELLIKANPKREGSRAHKKFALLMEMDGKTIGEYRAKEGRYPTLDFEKGWTSTEIRWALKQGWIKIVAVKKMEHAA